MRDPERIPRVLAAVEGAWKKSPDLRLGQLIYNAIGDRRVGRTEQRLFFIGDDALVRELYRIPGGDDERAE